MKFQHYDLGNLKGGEIVEVRGIRGTGCRFKENSGDAYHNSSTSSLK